MVDGVVAGGCAGVAGGSGVGVGVVVVVVDVVEEVVGEEGVVAMSLDAEDAEGDGVAPAAAWNAVR